MPKIVKIVDSEEKVAEVHHAALEIYKLYMEEKHPDLTSSTDTFFNRAGRAITSVLSTGEPPQKIYENIKTMLRVHSGEIPGSYLRHLSGDVRKLHDAVDKALLAKYVSNPKQLELAAINSDSRCVRRVVGGMIGFKHTLKKDGKKDSSRQVIATDTIIKFLESTVCDDPEDVKELLPLLQAICEGMSFGDIENGKGFSRLAHVLEVIRSDDFLHSLSADASTAKRVNLTPSGGVFYTNRLDDADCDPEGIAPSIGVEPTNESTADFQATKNPGSGDDDEENSTNVNLENAANVDAADTATIDATDMPLDTPKIVKIVDSEKKVAEVQRGAFEIYKLYMEEKYPHLTSPTGTLANRAGGAVPSVFATGEPPQTAYQFIKDMLGVHSGEIPGSYLKYLSGDVRRLHDAVDKALLAKYVSNPKQLKLAAINSDNRCVRGVVGGMLGFRHTLKKDGKEDSSRQVIAVDLIIIFLGSTAYREREALTGLLQDLQANCEGMSGIKNGKGFRRLARVLKVIGSNNFLRSLSADTSTANGASARDSDERVKFIPSGGVFYTNRPDDADCDPEGIAPSIGDVDAAENAGNLSTNGKISLAGNADTLFGSGATKDNSADIATIDVTDLSFESTLSNNRL